MKLSYQAICHRGLVRGNNEDAVLIGDRILRDDSDSFSFDIPENGIVFPAIVCDGVGGRDNGEVASMTACEELQRFCNSITPDIEENELIMKVKQAFASFNEKILDKAAGSGMACTATGIIVLGDKGLVLNAGDSRTYRLRYDNFKQLTRDHTIMRDGRRLISNCLGLEDVTVDITPTALVPGDIFIIASDGLFDMVADSAIAENASSAESLLNLALNNGGCDNTSIISLQFSLIE